MPVSIQGLTDQNKPEEASVSIIERLNQFFIDISPIPQKEKLFFLQYLSVMLKSGISLSAGLNTLAKQTPNKRFAKILADVSSKVEKGVTFSESLRSHERIFGELFINMVEAGELSGKLENVLNRLYLQSKKSYELKSKVKGALTYPMVVLFAMGGIGTFMIFFIVPKITSMFKEFDAELPLPTKVLIGISDFVVQNALFTIGITAALITTLIQILRTQKGRYLFQTLLLRAPIFSEIIKKINMAQFARTVSSLMKTDIMIVKTFQITSNVMGNLHYRYALLEMGEAIKKGKKISDAISQHPNLFPPVIVQMMSVGEETGEIDNILEELAEFYETEIDQTMENLPAIIEPVLILVMGLGIGAIAVAIIMPMMSLSSAV